MRFGLACITDHPFSSASVRSARASTAKTLVANERDELVGKEMLFNVHLPSEHLNLSERVAAILEARRALH